MRTRSLLVLIALALPLVAQEMPTPPKELKAYDRLLGRWEATGTFRPGPGEDPLPWTSVQHTRKVMGGFFIRDDMVLDLGPMGKMGFVSFTAVDPESKKHFVYSVTSEGKLTKTENTWIDDDSVMTMTTGFNMGQRNMERWVTNINDDGSLSFKGQVANDAGPFFVHVEGTAKKADGAAPDVSKIGAFAGTEPAEPMHRILKGAGKYHVTGQYSMMPGSEPMTFTGKEKMGSLFGGMICEFTVKGDDGSYEGAGFMGWDAIDDCYKTVHLDTMGSAHMTKGWFIDDTMVSTMSAIHMGQPMLLRSVITFNDKGRPTKAISHGMLGNHEPWVSMTATYRHEASKGN